LQRDATNEVPMTKQQLEWMAKDAGSPDHFNPAHVFSNFSDHHIVS
jgi:hypothetical protein